MWLQQLTEHSLTNFPNGEITVALCGSLAALPTNNSLCTYEYLNKQYTIMILPLNKYCKITVFGITNNDRSNWTQYRVIIKFKINIKKYINPLIICLILKANFHYPESCTRVSKQLHRKKLVVIQLLPTIHLMPIAVKVIFLYLCYKFRFQIF